MLRLIEFYRVLIRYRLDLLMSNRHWLLRLLVGLHPATWIAKPDKPRAQRLRLALQSLGPIFVKFGQVLSTRPDLLAEDIALELAKLQDQVAPFAGIAQEIEKIYGQTSAELFAEFDQQPLASASVAQVHKATLHTGENVVLKVLRPGVEKLVARDVKLLYKLASWVEVLLPFGKRLRAKEVVDQFHHHLQDELDLTREAANASQLKRNFRGSSILKLPEIYWDYVQSRALVMEYMDGIAVSDVAALDTAGIDRKMLAKRGVEIFFTQVFRDSFFHADMHPGNIFVGKDKPEDPYYIGVDFGIIGSLSAEDQYYLAENLLAFFNQDYRKVAELHVQCGWVPADTSVVRFEAAVRSVTEPILAKPLKDISFAKLVLNLFKTAREFNMTVQPQLVLLQKTLFNIEGLGRQLYPELNLWEEAKPQIERWMKKKVDFKVFAGKIVKHFPKWLDHLPELPELVYQALQQTKPSVEPMPVSKPGLKPIKAFGFGVAAALLVSVALFNQQPAMPQLIASAVTAIAVGLV